LEGTQTEYIIVALRRMSAEGTAPTNHKAERTEPGAIHFWLSPCTVKAIEEFQRHEPDMPTLLGALEKLVEMGLEAAAKRKPKPEPKK
jgi:hypothetical protein